jgi:hypothetical protein
MGPLGRPIGVWIASTYLLGMLVLSASDSGAPIWHGSATAALMSAVVLLGVLLLLLLSRWAVLTTAVVAGMQAAFYLVFMVDPPSVIPLLGLGSPAHDIYVVPIRDHVTPLVYLAGTVTVPLYATWLWRAGVLR